MDSSGWVSSFNYAAAASGVSNTIGVQGSRQIASLSYGACVKAASGQCSITWSRVSLPNDVTRTFIEPLLLTNSHQQIFLPFP